MVINNAVGAWQLCSVIMSWPNPELVRFAFCATLAISLFATSSDRAKFFEIRHQYAAIRGRAARDRTTNGFYTNTFGEVSVSSWPLSCIPLVNGRPTLTALQYSSLVRCHVAELALLVAATATSGRETVYALGTSLLLLLLLLGQRMAQMQGLVSGHKDVLAVWCLAALLVAECQGQPEDAVSAMQVLLAAGYGIPGVTKFLLPKLQSRGWFSWVDGKTLQCILLERAVLFDNRLACAVACQPVLCVLGSVATVCFENLWILLPLVPSQLALVLLVTGVSFHVSCTLLLGINFLPFWLPCYACLIPHAAGSAQLDTPSMGNGTRCLLCLFWLGVIWFYVELVRSRRVPEGKLWPLGITPYYSGYCTGYTPEPDGRVPVRAVVIYISRTEAPQEAHVWHPPVCSYFARRVNAEYRATGSVQQASAANLLLLSLAEESRDDCGGSAVFADQVHSVRWVEKTKTWDGRGFRLEEHQEDKLVLVGEELCQAIVDARK